MGDIIKLLSESVANQIAAGEVVQRPASAVKELMENAVDAGATEIMLIIKDAGKTMIQVVDNGCGMSDRDARMCFERHATSKIKSANDLLAIRTLGFRGEALASIASISQVELKSKRTEDDIGTSIQIHGSEFISQEAVSCSDGTAVIIKNLFYNVPARRNFLKSNTLELKYIMEEFNRVALVHPDISFKLYNQDKILIQLSPSNLKQRLVALLGSSYNQRLIPVQQESNLVNLTGFIGKPEFARKTRGEQYFFANGRFIKNPYLNHAVENAFQELIMKDTFPTYFIYLEVDPSSIDVNIHPTKTEINFQDAKSIYAILNAAIKQSIGRYNLTPALDFETEKSLDLPPLPKDHPITPPTIRINPEYNPFEKQTRPQMEFNYKVSGSERGVQWQQLYDPLKEIHPRQIEVPDLEESVYPIIQVENKFLVTQIQQGVVIVDQQAAHERILYEKFIQQEKNGSDGAQKLLLPLTIQLSPDDSQMILDLSDSLSQAGFDVSEFGKNTFVVHSAPSGVESSEIQLLIEGILEAYKSETDGFKNKGAHQLARTMARRLSIKHGRHLNPRESSALFSDLLRCAAPDITPEGKPTMYLLDFDELGKKFKHTT
ncbi:MAG: DNA mismatch repair endonuclease MutL [Bacteroidales bacterium]|nr:DNA mismatch repair endonuclease MutL [Bacteroidales bacterium]